MNGVGWLLLFLYSYFNTGTVIINIMHIKKKKERRKMREERGMRRSRNV